MPLPLLSIPIGIISGACYGYEKDREFLETGTYFGPGTRHVSRLFDPFRDFPNGPMPGECAYDEIPIEDCVDRE